MKEFRDLPRYSLTHLKATAYIKSIGENFILKNASLSGIQLLCHSDLLPKTPFAVEIKLLERRSFLIDAQTVWKKEIDGKIKAGLSLHFTDTRVFQRWLQMMKALHLHQRK